ncbi:hydroxymethylbilane synthase [Segniliparus rugosus]|uniref:Porphobilinogen deaminase n=1 Tax=Segniliparus rugosus (strain ATCC BAA-974 / DSM 45345 / CCUG 50838 / CIP 108380 / JCM 13579 / CDC 945) TaxID=679197 RepID=E5XPF5_SEGRC|nr:hydroxymethylbilane synthase [Segniliparus rugosus]EFV13766.1 porphobilinogen deaminase [Segniliparus rugosus ATCC BAA-974]
MIRVGTRGSLLATTQAATVRDAIRALGEQAELVIVNTIGDRVSGPIVEIGVGVFTSALRDALLADEIDVAVHSLKDLPTAQDPRFSLVAVPERADPRDVLVSRSGSRLADLPPGSAVGTGAPRRSAQLRLARADLEIQPIRGNLDSRMRKVATAECDAIVVARAGLLRLGREQEATEILDPAVMLPAPGQGALAVECRSEAPVSLTEVLGRLDHEHSRVTSAAERAVLAELSAGCSGPVGALARIDAQTLRVEAAVCALDGSRQIREAQSAQLLNESHAAALGRRVAESLRSMGAMELVGAVQDTPGLS